MSELDFHVLVPARFASSRLPGKPLLEIAGKPMIRRVVEQCEQAGARSVVVATDDERIADCVSGFGGRFVMTAPHHASGSDRIAEACAVLGLGDDEVVVNVQGDEPDMPPGLIVQLARALRDHPSIPMTTACAPLCEPGQVTDPSVVKVVRDASGKALYFSRAPVPWVRREDSSAPGDDAMPHLRRHLGIYAYRAGFLKQYAALAPSPLETLEKLEQLRVLWHGYDILCIEAGEIPAPGIDTEADLAAARRRFAESAAETGSGPGD